MAKQSDSDLEIMTGGILLSIEDSVGNIEKITKFLDNHFKGLDASKLPEYQQAINAIKAYKEVLISHFTEKYKESFSKK